MKNNIQRQIIENSNLSIIIPEAKASGLANNQVFIEHKANVGNYLFITHIPALVDFDEEIAEAITNAIQEKRTVTLGITKQHHQFTVNYCK